MFQNILNAKLLPILLLLSVSGCFHFDLRHHGTIRDAETGQPITNALVSLTSAYTCFLPPNPGGPNSQFLGNIEHRSDSQGEYLLSSQFSFLPPLLCITDSDLNILKSGYFPSRVVVPEYRNDIDLYPINYYIDYLHYVESASKGHLNPPYFDWNSQEFKDYKHELSTMAVMDYRKIGEEGVVLEVAGARFTQLRCDSNFDFNSPGFYSAKGFTLGIEGIVCFVFNEANGKWMAVDSRNRILGTQFERYQVSFPQHAEAYQVSASLEDNNHSVCVAAFNEQKCTAFNDEIEIMKRFGFTFFIKFTNGALKEYSALRRNNTFDGNLSEIKSFTSSLFQGKTIKSLDIGRSVGTRTIYFTTGNSKVYRMNFAGVADSRITIINKSGEH